MAILTLWYSPGACSLAPHILLRETGLHFEPIKMQLGPGGPPLPEEFRAINPKMRVPVLGVDNHLITEVPAIFTTVATISNQKALLGTNLIDTARVYEWLNWLSGTVHTQGFGALWRPNRFTDEPEFYPKLTKKATETIISSFTEIEEKLSGVYAVGDAYTVVDPYLFVFWRWGSRIGLDMEKSYPKWAAHTSNVVSRESTKAALAFEQILAYEKL